MAGLRDQVRKNTIFHWVGDILDELALLPTVKRGARHALSQCAELQKHLAGKELFLCLDFDGTLAPIVEQPEMAAMPDSIRTLIEVLREHYPIAVISGRSLQDLKCRVALPGLIYGGNHGAEMEGFTASVEGRPHLAAFLSAVHQAFAAFSGVQVRIRRHRQYPFQGGSNRFTWSSFWRYFRSWLGTYADTVPISPKGEKGL